MIIKCKMSWDGKNPIFTGYYDTSAPWDKIDRFFVDRFNVHAMDTLFKTHPFYQVKMDYKTDSLVISRNGSKWTCDLETIQVDSGKIAVFPIHAACFSSKPWYNWDIYTSKLSFSIDQIRSVLLFGLQEGMAAGLTNSKRIDGMSPEDFAWKYVLAHVGTNSDNSLD